jgi:hypothetical protein
MSIPTKYRLGRETIHAIDGAMWLECYQRAPELQVRTRRGPPPPDEAGRKAYVRLLLKAKQDWARRTPDTDACDWSAQETMRLVQFWSRHATEGILGNAQEPLKQLLRRLPEVQARISAGTPLSEDHPHFRQWVACALIVREANILRTPYSWRDLAGIVCVHSMTAWRDTSGYRESIHHDTDPLCVITSLVLQAMHVTRTPHAVSAVLQAILRQKK